MIRQGIEVRITALLPAGMNHCLLPSGVLLVRDEAELDIILNELNSQQAKEINPQPKRSTMYEWAASEFDTFMRPHWPRFKRITADPLTSGSTVGIEHLIYSDGTITISFTSTGEWMRLSIRKGKDIIKNEQYDDFPTVKDDVLAVINEVKGS